MTGIEHKSGNHFQRESFRQIPGSGTGIQPPVFVGKKCTCAGEVTENKTVFFDDPVAGSTDRTAYYGNAGI